MSRPLTPSVQPYRMPRHDELPGPVAPWELDPGRAAVVFHDMQEFFLRSFGDADSPRDALVENCVRVRDAARAGGLPIGYSAQPGSMTSEERGLLSAFWGPGMNRSAADRAIIAPLAPEPDDRVFTKWRYSAFHASDLESWLRENGRDQVVLCGVYAHIGVLATAVDAFSRDIETFLAADAVADFSEENHRLALEYAARNCAVVTTTAGVTRALDASRRATAARA